LTPFLALLAAAALEKLRALRPRLLGKFLLGLVGAGLILNAAYAGCQLYLLMNQDPRDRALLALFALKPASVGIQDTPWFQNPPVSPFNAGKSTQEFFELWRKTAPYRIIVTDWETEILLKEKPQTYVISDLQYADFLRLGVFPVRDFMTTLAKSYQKESRFANPLPLDWVGGGRGSAPPDWLYLKPTITLYSDWQVKDQ
jgi:hypothetical protein